MRRSQLSGAKKRKLKEKKKLAKKLMEGSLLQFTINTNDDSAVKKASDVGKRETAENSEENSSSPLDCAEKTETAENREVNNSNSFDCAEKTETAENSEENNSNTLDCAEKTETAENGEENSSSLLDCAEKTETCENSKENSSSALDCAEKTETAENREENSSNTLDCAEKTETAENGEENSSSALDCAEKMKPEKFKETAFIETVTEEFNDDPATWEKITDKMQEYFLRYPVPQNAHLICKTERFIGENKRTLTEAHFYRCKSNQQKIKRDWLVLSSSTFTLFCWVCKLFAKTLLSSLSTSGYSDWKHATERLHEHENSYFHREAVCTLMQRKQTTCRIDSNMAEQANYEVKYWFDVLRRVVAITKFLSSRGLPFFGRNETIGSCSNGNFLGCMELISEFDPFLAKHLQKYGNPGSGKTSYLSSTTLNEFIDLMATEVSNVIINEVTSAKFYSIIVDSTPDLSHTDQLTFVIRYVSSDCEPVERFLTFIPIRGHSSAYLEETILSYIESVGLHIADCRGQSYDNASNMAGKYTGLQARFRALNPLADFVPCAAHSLNLVVVKAVECNGRVLDFFTFLQEMYNFFSSSTHRWKLLTDNINENKQFLTLKSRSITRWCANAAATRALKENYKNILQVLSVISTDSEESPSTRNEANSLYKKMQKFETAVCATLWDSILQRIDCVNKNLQNPNLDLSVVPEYFTSLIEYINFIRDNFEEFEDKAYELIGHKSYSVSRVRKTPKSVYDGQCPEASLNNRDTFKISCFYTACDTLLSHLRTRMSAYEGILNKFSCLFSTDKQFSYENAKSLQKIYPDDLETVFPEELVHVLPTIQNKLTVTEKLKKIHNFGVKDTFANVETALKLFLTLPLSNCSGERSFSLLKRIKSPLRTLITDTKLSSLALLSMESDITLNIDYEHVINNFTAKRLRRKCIKNI